MQAEWAESVCSDVGRSGVHFGEESVAQLRCWVELLGHEDDSKLTIFTVASQEHDANISFRILFQSTPNTSRPCSCQFRIGKS